MTFTPERNPNPDAFYEAVDTVEKCNCNTCDVEFDLDELITVRSTKGNFFYRVCSECIVIEENN